MRLGFSAELIQPALGKFVVHKLSRSRITLSAQLNLNDPPTSILSRSRQHAGRSPHLSIAFLAHGRLRRFTSATQRPESCLRLRPGASRLTPRPTSSGRYIPRGGARQ
jgi:hypothetical protein